MGSWLRSNYEYVPIGYYFISCYLYESKLQNIFWTIFGLEFCHQGRFVTHMFVWVMSRAIDYIIFYPLSWVFRISSLGGTLNTRL